MSRHLLTGSELTPEATRALVDRAVALKARPRSSSVLERRTVALIFELASTRTRTSMEAGIVELGGHPMILRSAEMQLARGESVRDTALVLSRHAALIGLRTASEALLAELAAHATVPVVNLLSPDHHPCQAYADLLTLQETFGTLDGLKLAYVGDGNNVARSLAVIGALAGVQVAVASPEGFALDPATVPADTQLTHDPREAVADAHAVYADVWVSMGDDEATAAARRSALVPFVLDDALLDAAAPDAIALHCLPAHPGEEVTADVLYGGRQRIWDQAENRRHAQKALMETLLG